MRRLRSSIFCWQPQHALVVLKDERRNICKDVAGLLTLQRRYRLTRIARMFVVGFSRPAFLASGERRGARAPFSGDLAGPSPTGSAGIHSDQRLDLGDHAVNGTGFTAEPSASVTSDGTSRTMLQRTGQEWQADHVFRHEPNAIECFC